MNRMSGATAKAASAPVVSVVVPAFNEQDCIRAFYRRTTAVFEQQRLAYEIVFVDDGSTDRSWALITALKRADRRVVGIKLSRNFGKEAALSAGLDAARGQAAIVIDADLQDPPELIPQMLEAWRSGYQIVRMRRHSRLGESAFKKVCAAGFYRLLNQISDCPIPQDTGDFCLLSRVVLDSLARLQEKNRYTKGIFAWVGFKTTYLDYVRDPRTAGTTKWNFLALCGLALDGITSFSVAPLKWISGLGALTSVLGLLFGLFIVFKALVLGEHIQGYPTIMATLTFLGGVQLLTIGIVGIYVGKIFTETKDRPIYILDETEQSEATQQNGKAVGDRGSVQRLSAVSDAEALLH